MNNKIKNILGILILVIVIVVFYIFQSSNNINSNTFITSGLLLSKDEEGDSHSIILQILGEDKESELKEITIYVKNKKLWDGLKKDKYYYMTYSQDDSKNKTLIKAQLNESLRETIYDKALKEENKKTEQEEKLEYVHLSGDKLDTSDLTLLDSKKVDLDRDGEDESIEMYTTAQRYDNGEIAWDDGQKWFLIIKDEDGEFVLFDDYIQLGALEFWVFTSKDDYHIATLQTGSATFKLSDFKYDNKEKGFVKKDIFNPDYLNVIYNSSIK